MLKIQILQIYLILVIAAVLNKTNQLIMKVWINKFVLNTFLLIELILVLRFGNYPAVFNHLNDLEPELIDLYFKNGPSQTSSNDFPNKSFPLIPFVVENSKTHIAHNKEIIRHNIIFWQTFFLFSWTQKG
jgi:hypothetical protein